MLAELPGSEAPKRDEVPVRPLAAAELAAVEAAEMVAVAPARRTGHWHGAKSTAASPIAGSRRNKIKCRANTELQSGELEKASYAD